MQTHAPAKLNLCLFLGPRREDGLHELCSLFEPLALADPIEVEDGGARRGRLRGGRGREPRGAGAGGAARAGLGAGAAADRDREADPGRRRASAAARADAAAVLRLAAGEVAELERLAAGLGADVPSQLRPSLALVRGAGERVARLPDPEPHAVVLLPGGGGLWTAEVFAEADRQGLGRTVEELDALAERLLAAAGAGASPLAYAELLANDLEPAARAAAAGDRRGARRPARGRRAAGAAHRLGPDRVRPLRGPRARPRRRRRGSTATTRSSARPAGRRCRERDEAARAASDSASGPCRVVIAVGGDRRLRRLHPLRRPREDARRRLRHARRLDLPAGRRLRLRRDRRLRRPARPGGDGDDPRRRRRRPGRDQRLPGDRDRLADGLARRQHQLLHRPAPRARVPAEERARGSGSGTSASTRSTTTSPATAARRSSSAASSASCGPSRRSSPAARGCATGPSSRTASSAPGSG